MSGKTIHATCVVVGESGVLIRGPSGSGKSTLARALIDNYLRRGLFARLVGDDRVTLQVCSGRLIARSLAVIAGRLEIRGIGLVSVPHEDAARVCLVVDCLAEEPPRYPPEGATEVTIFGVLLPVLALNAGPGAAELVLKSLATLALPNAVATV